MIELRAMTVKERRAFQNYIKEKQGNATGEDLANWIIDNLYPELKGKELYPDMLVAIFEKTNDLTKAEVEKQGKELVKNW